LTRGYDNGVIWFTDGSNEVEINTSGDYEEESEDDENA
jgi:hypothetical protein